MKVRRNYLMFYTALYTIFTLLALSFTVSVQAKDATYDYSIYKYSLSSNELSVYTQIYDKAMAFDDRMFNLKAPSTMSLYLVNVSFAELMVSCTLICSAGKVARVKMPAGLFR